MYIHIRVPVKILRTELGGGGGESRGGRPGLPVPNSPYSLCGRKAKLNERSSEHVLYQGSLLR